MPEGHPDPATLLAAIALRRDRQAFATLFQHYAPRIKSYLMARHIGDSVAEELTQEVMLAVWRRAEQFDPQRGAASTWIFTVARNCLIDLTRREKRPQAELSDPSAAPDVVRLEDEILSREAHDHLRAALAELPAEQGDVLRRSYFAGQSLRQIATSGSLPLGTVKTRLRLALERLRGVIGRRRAQ